MIDVQNLIPSFSFPQSGDVGHVMPAMPGIHAQQKP